MSLQPPRTLGLLDAVSIVAGTIIGAGIFLVPNLVAKQIASPYAILAVWLFSGLLSLAGALGFAELGAMIPSSGGQYAYLREAFGPLPAFLCGWTFFLAIATAAIAWLATSFAVYLSYFVPLEAWQRQLVAVSLIGALSVVNYRGVRGGAAVQKLFAVAKVAGILLLIGAAWLSPVNHWPAAEFTMPTVSEWGLAMVACLLTFDGWAVLPMVAGEVKSPGRNLPLGLLSGLLICIALYVSANAAYLKVLPVADTARTERVAAQVAEITIGGNGGAVVAAIVLLSIIGAVNGWILAAPRIYMAQAQDGLFFRRFGELHPRYLTPGFAILMQFLWAAVLCVSGTYEALGSYVMFAAWLFYGLTVLGVMVLRRARPSAPRPYRVWAYPLLPLLFAAVSLGFVANSLVNDPKPSLSAAALIAAGLPVYYLWRRDGTVLDKIEIRRVGRAVEGGGLENR
ncbi:MAG: amino acid permease [Acidobacteria bacterium]|nr:amino acid permease [Acidobacteriota bacterium]